jgi:hypothetical protein
MGTFARVVAVQAINLAEITSLNRHPIPWLWTGVGMSSGVIDASPIRTLGMGAMRGAA